MTLLAFDAPFPVAAHYDIPADTTLWEPQAYRQVRQKKNEKSAGMTPVRPRAPFRTIAASMTPRRGSRLAPALACTFGVYLVGFDLPAPALYVGVAGDGSDRPGGRGRPEGIGARLAKHRVKATASHVGTAEGNGGANHTRGWRGFAVARYRHVGGPGDVCADMRVAVGTLDAPASPRSALEYLEDQIEADAGGIRAAIIRLLWPGADPRCVTMLTTGTKSGRKPADPSIRLWDGSVFRV